MVFLRVLLDGGCKLLALLNEDVDHVVATTETSDLFLLRLISHLNFVLLLLILFRHIDVLNE